VEDQNLAFVVITDDQPSGAEEGDVHRIPLCVDTPLLVDLREVLEAHDASQHAGPRPLCRADFPHCLRDGLGIWETVAIRSERDDDLHGYTFHQERFDLVQ
jgi:hypothetical protein